MWLAVAGCARSALLFALDQRSWLSAKGRYLGFDPAQADQAGTRKGVEHQPSVRQGEAH